MKSKDTLALVRIGFHHIEGPPTNAMRHITASSVEHNLKTNVSIAFHEPFRSGGAS
jgi:hypothetical protein